MNKWTALKKAAEHFNVSRQTLYQLLSSRERTEHYRAAGLVMKVGKLWKFDIEAIEKNGGLP